MWYTKGKEGALSAADERAAVKEEEERVRPPPLSQLQAAHPAAQLMQEALGLRPVTARRGASALDARETQELLKREGGADGLGGGEEAVAERVKGLGYSRLAADSGPARPKQGEEWGTREVLGGLVEPAAALVAPAPPPAARAQRHDSASSSSSSGGGGGGGGERRAEKRARKEARKERRAEKRARKEERRAKRRRSRSRSREEGRRRSRSRDEQRRSRSRDRGRADERR